MKRIYYKAPCLEPHEMVQKKRKSGVQRRVDNMAECKFLDSEFRHFNKALSVEGQIIFITIIIRKNIKKCFNI